MNLETSISKRKQVFVDWFSENAAKTLPAMRVTPSLSAIQSRPGRGSATNPSRLGIFTAGKDLASSRVSAGTPQSIADQLQQWFEEEDADGFNIMSPRPQNRYTHLAAPARAG
jgi:alkanesulfonate monooxygenase SsuD/methylene tetrahydromethanopterin reductase-like flavin-dependent oxidoreductase (luciferase family)